jgi:hypothetical protein
MVRSWFARIVKDVSMLLSLAAKALIAPVLLALAAIVEHKWGVAMGGWLLGLPLTSGPASFFLLTEHGPRFAENAALGMLLGLVGAGVFVAGYSLAARGRSWRRSLAMAGIACLTVTFALSQVHLSLTATLVFAAVVLGIVAIVARGPKRAATGTGDAAVSSRRGLVIRMIAASAVVLGVSVASTVLGSVLIGMLATIPAITAVMAVSTHRSSGKDCARRMLRGSIAGMWGGAAFFAVVALMVMTATPGITYLIAVVAAAAVAALVGKVEARVSTIGAPATVAVA